MLNTITSKINFPKYNTKPMLLHLYIYIYIYDNATKVVYTNPSVFNLPLSDIIIYD